MMLKTAKYSLFLLLLVITLLLLAPFFIDANRYKPLLIKYAEEASGQSIETGNLSLSFFPSVKLRIEDVHVMNTLDFSGRDMLHIEHVDLQLATLPLLNSQIEIHRLMLQSPTLRLAQHATLTEDDQAPPKQHVSSEWLEMNVMKMLAAIRAKSIRIHQGQLIWESPQSNAAPINVSAFNFTIDDVQINAPMRFSMGGHIDQARIEIKGRIGPLQPLLSGKKTIGQVPLQMQVKASQLSVATLYPAWGDFFTEKGQQLVDGEGRIEQRPDGVRISDGQLTLGGNQPFALQWHIDMPNNTLVNVRKFTLLERGKMVLESHGEIRLSEVSPTFELRLESRKINRADLLTMWPEVGRYYQQPPQEEPQRPLWQEFRMGALLSGGVNHVDIKSLQLFLDNERLRLSGMLEWGEQPRLNLRMSTAALHLDPWLPKKHHEPQTEAMPLSQVEASPQEAEQHEQTDLPITMDTEPDLRWLKPWRLDVELQADQIFAHGLALSHLNALLTGRKGRLTLKPLRFDIADGSFDGRININASRYPTYWRTSGTLEKVQLSPLLSALEATHPMGGELGWKGSLGAKGMLTHSIKSSLTGQGEFLLRDGALYGFDITSLLQSIGKDTSKSNQKTTFSQLSGSVKIMRGVIHNDDLFLLAPRLRVTGQGRINLSDSELDYRLRPRLIETSGETDHHIVIPLRLSGDITAPTIAFDFSGASTYSP
ncbi:MAG: AsmA family protein [Mariprofundaceae bacterium]